MKLTTYTPELRAEAVRLVLAQGLTLDEAAKRIAMPKRHWLTGLRLPSGVQTRRRHPVLSR